MPFDAPFKNAFFKNDLIYGLSVMRFKYAKKGPCFPGRALSLDNEGAPYYVDHFILPHELRIHELCDNSYLTSHEMTWMASDKQGNFLDYLRNHEDLKYRCLTNYDLPHRLDIADDEGEGDSTDDQAMGCQPDSVDKNLSRKCKSALAWMTSDGIGHIHFILDGINIDAVIGKFAGYGTGFTARELRWVYRNRNNIKVREGVQFWMGGSPVAPPWTLNPAPWDRYQPRRR